MVQNTVDIQVFMYVLCGRFCFWQISVQPRQICKKALYSIHDEASTGAIALLLYTRAFIPTAVCSVFFRAPRTCLLHAQAIDGIKHDSAELVRDALSREFSDPEERLEASGPSGAPFSFANAVRRSCGKYYVFFASSLTQQPGCYGKISMIVPGPISR